MFKTFINFNYSQQQRRQLPTTLFHKQFMIVSIRVTLIGNHINTHNNYMIINYDFSIRFECMY